MIVSDKDIRVVGLIVIRIFLFSLLKILIDLVFGMFLRVFDSVFVYCSRIVEDIVLCLGISVLIDVKVLVFLVLNFGFVMFCGNLWDVLLILFWIFD